MSQDPKKTWQMQLQWFGKHLGFCTWLQATCTDTDGKRKEKRCRAAKNTPPRLDNKTLSFLNIPRISTVMLRIYATMTLILWRAGRGQSTNSSLSIMHHGDKSLNHLCPEAGNEQIHLIKRYEVGVCWWISGLMVFHVNATHWVWIQIVQSTPCPLYYEHWHLQRAF